MIDKMNTGIQSALKNPSVLVALGIAFLLIVMGTGLLGLSLSVIILFLLFIFVIPTLLYHALKKIADPVPLWLPLLLVILVVGIFSSGLAGGQGLVENIIIPFSLIFLLSTLAVIGPYPLFEKKIGAKNPWQVFTLMSFVGVALFFFSTMGERLEGQPSPPLFSTFPLSGWIFDGLANILHLQDAVYAFDSHVYSILWACAFYLEVFFITFLYYAVLGWVSSANTGAGKE